MSVDVISRLGGEAATQAANLELIQVMTHNHLAGGYIDQFSVGFRYDYTLVSFGYCSSSEEARTLPRHLAPSVMGSDQSIETPYHPGSESSGGLRPADHIHGLTSLVAGAPSLGLPEKTKLVKEVVAIASHAVSEDDCTQAPKPALSPRQARRAALSQLKAMAVREDFREKNGQPGVFASSELNRLRTSLKKEWRFEEDKLASVVSVVAGASGLLVVRKMLRK